MSPSLSLLFTTRQYRRECLRRLNLDLNEELDYMDAFSRDNPKNYQIWHHRRTIVEWLGNGERELKFCASVFDVDAKNYHAWAHR
jgi:protein farnesyltransferase/geranylgeranyltransferase type-1 subunit alpha